MLRAAGTPISSAIGSGSLEFIVTATANRSESTGGSNRKSRLADPARAAWAFCPFALPTENAYVSDARGKPLDSAFFSLTCSCQVLVYLGGLCCSESLTPDYAAKTPPPGLSQKRTASHEPGRSIHP